MQGWQTSRAGQRDVEAPGTGERGWDKKEKGSSSTQRCRLGEEGGRNYGISLNDPPTSQYTENQHSFTRIHTKIQTALPDQSQHREPTEPRPGPRQEHTTQAPPRRDDSKAEAEPQPHESPAPESGQ